MTYRAATGTDYKSLVEQIRYDWVDGVFYWVKKAYNTPDPGNGTPTNGRRVTHVRGQRADVSRGDRRVICHNNILFNLNKLAFFCVLGRPPRGKVTHLNAVPNDYRWENLVDGEGRAIINLGPGPVRKEVRNAMVESSAPYEGPVLVGGVWIDA